MGPWVCTGALWDYVILLPAPTRDRLFYVLKSGSKHKKAEFYLMFSHISQTEFVQYMKQLLPDV